MGQWHDDMNDIVGFNPGEAGKRWKFLKGNPYYFTWVNPEMTGAAVVVDTSDSASNLVDKTEAKIFTSRFEAIDQQGRDIVLVQPHTYRSERFFRAYLEWVHRDRPADDGTYPSVSVAAWDPAAPPDAARYTCPVPIQADFRVTGLIKDGEWQDPAPLEAARSLLESRYDLKIGIWDLAGNPTLRQTLLDTVPVAAAPAREAAVPTAAAERAQARVTAKMDEAAAAKKVLANIQRKYFRPLLDVGWKRWPNARGILRLPFTEPLQRYPGETRPVPLVQLSLSILKRQCHISASTSMYNQVDIEEYVEARREVLEAIAAPDAAPLGSPWPTLQQTRGGWADHIEWEEWVSSVVSRTPLWVEAFTELALECLRIHELNSQQYAESQGPGGQRAMTIHVEIPRDLRHTPPNDG
jgi:hypothetical protein